MTETETIWRELHNRLGLADADAARLREKRGFSEEAIRMWGFRTSCATNRELILDLANTFPQWQDAMVSLDIIRRTTEGLVAAPQLCGFGKSTQKDEHGKDLWKPGVNPILIPYYNSSGNIDFLRAHKGNPRRPKSVDPLDEDYEPNRVYCPFLLRTVSANARGATQAANYCVITEGEFKALALWMCGIPALAFPGIHAARNGAFRRRLVEILKEFEINKLIFIFDNEDKGNPDLACYKPDPYDRYDTIVYAKWTAGTLRAQGILTHVGVLPNEWRIDGKADWDGALAGFVAKHGPEKGATIARKEFLKVISAAEEDVGFMTLFPGEAEAVVQNKLQKLYMAKHCPYGDDDFLSLAQRLKKSAYKLSASDRGVRLRLADAMLKCAGCYYKLTPYFEKYDDREAAIAARERARAAGDWLTVKETDQLLLGMPEPISNFVMSCDYRLISSAGEVEYLVRARNIHNERVEQHVRFTSHSLARLAEFRKVCIGVLKSTYKGGERDLQNLTSDLQSSSAHREIQEIECYGYVEETGIWKAADIAYDYEGRAILPDNNRVFWHDGRGYQTDFMASHVGHGFAQGAPIFGKLDIEKAADTFLAFSKHLFEAIGGYDGWLAFGSVLAYAAHPEILKTYKGAPGLWITGRRGSGKTTICEWLTKIWGLPGKFISLADTTTGNSVARELSKYSCIPAFYDEFDATGTRPDVQEMLKNAFNRSASVKAVFDNSNRTRSIIPRTTPLVGGENSTRNSAARQRYVQVIMAEERAKGSATERLKTMNRIDDSFRHLGHFLVKNRKAFSEIVLSETRNWVESHSVNEFIPSVRMRFVSGTPCAAWFAALELLQRATHRPEFVEIASRTEEFYGFAVEHACESFHESSETTYINTLWLDILAMLKDSHSSVRKFFFLRYGRVNGDRRLAETKKDRSQGFVPVMFMAYREAYFFYEQEVRKTGRVAKLSRGDLERELRGEKYWIRPPENDSHRVRNGKIRETCWAFNLDDHPFGEQFHGALIEEDQHNPNETHFPELSDETDH